MEKKHTDSHNENGQYDTVTYLLYFTFASKKFSRFYRFQQTLWMA